MIQPVEQVLVDAGLYAVTVAFNLVNLVVGKSGFHVQFKVWERLSDGLGDSLNV